MFSTRLGKYHSIMVDTALEVKLDPCLPFICKMALYGNTSRAHYIKNWRKIHTIFDISVFLI